MIDLSFLEKFTKGNKNKMARYIGMYMRFAPEAFDNMRRNIENGNWHQVKVDAHALKPQADYMGLPELKSVLAGIEQRVEREDYSGIRDAYIQAYALHCEAMESLQVFLDAL